jgi:SMI1-KNR4 cell-wall
VTNGATEADFAAAESGLGVELIPEHRALLAAENGWERWYGECFMMMYGTASLIEVNAEIERHPGFLAFASDGSREIVGLDMRVKSPPVVMIDITSAGWEDALFQADSLSEFMAQRAGHEDFRWDEPYKPNA